MLSSQETRSCRCCCARRSRIDAHLQRLTTRWTCRRAAWRGPALRRWWNRWRPLVSVGQHKVSISIRDEASVGDGCVPGTWRGRRARRPLCAVWVPALLHDRIVPDEVIIHGEGRPWLNDSRREVSQKNCGIWVLVSSCSIKGSEAQLLTAKRPQLIPERVSAQGSNSAAAEPAEWLRNTEACETNNSSSRSPST